MANNYFRFKQFTVLQQHSAMKVTTDGCLFGAWVAGKISTKLEVRDRKGRTDEFKILDIGTGTGLLSLMIVQKNNAAIDALEIDAIAAAEAKQNVAASPWQHCIHVISSDVMQWLSDKKYDTIVCNPPFYENELKSPQKERNIAHHSTQLKLAELLEKIAAHLSGDGSCFLLLPAKREAETDALLYKNSMSIIQKIYVHQTNKHNAFRIMLHCSKKASAKAKTDHIFIKKENEYSAEFKNLLKDYYLFL